MLARVRGHRLFDKSFPLFARFAKSFVVSKIYYFTCILFIFNQKFYSARGVR